ncbi:sce7726 family protein [Brenneria goodwinii]|uniref:Sce7726 family protein n=1 Tax=Brenneria goodwinii TaxID=1109412 RepID=A0A0G4JXH0_9GAMM|nr:sce7726 family protein [Brenneria goodwinii]MCG8157422.1 sce7726 family protein [Brenneria goodwinii]MCG8161995.1 sce7726 family protein [Brenneria goodwinii]MCG8165236.1 sce7726 family protein [Brenneria goodwinii]MCG8170933.1 sce7726 family protein [Brenneria goodwinii]MCG8176101.1 sce7726 family protein [Brenneria goodwinii]
MKKNININKLNAKVFRRPLFYSLAKGADINNILSSFESMVVDNEKLTVRDFFCSIFDSLRDSYRNEYVYKSALVNKIVFGRHSPKTSASSIELPINNSIVDVAIFNGTSTAYEIKTEFDSPKRLVTQTPDYLDVFDRTYIVTHPDLADKYCSLDIPKVGVISLNHRDNLRVVKEAESNSENINIESIFNVLRRNEYVKIIEDYTSTNVHMPNGLIYDYCKNIFVSMPLDKANGYFIKAMKNRTINKDLIDYLYSLPACLRVLGYATPLSKKQKNYLIDLMDKELKFNRC